MIPKSYLERLHPPRNSEFDISILCKGISGTMATGGPGDIKEDGGPTDTQCQPSANNEAVLSFARKLGLYRAGSVWRARLAREETAQIRDDWGSRRLGRFRAARASELSRCLHWRAGGGGKPARGRRQYCRGSRRAGSTRRPYAFGHQLQPGRQSHTVAKPRLRLCA